MFFEDLSNYSYFSKFSNYGIINIGWLDSQYEYNKGKVPQKQLDALGKYYRFKANITLGFHSCQFCHSIIRCDILGKEYFLGTGEIWLQGSNGTIYACPDLIYHYMMEHEYFPPKEFLDALDSDARAVVPSMDDNSYVLVDINHKNCFPDNKPRSRNPAKESSFLKRIFRKIF